MTRNHQKARSAPRTWDIERKAYTFTTRPNPGSQTLDYTLALDRFLKDVGVATTKKDVNYVLKNSEVLVNGRRRHDRRFGVGFLDVVTVGDSSYILTFSEKGLLAPVAIDKKEAAGKLAAVRSVGMVRGGKLQLRLTDGHTLLVDKPVPAGATVRRGFAKNQIEATYSLEQQAPALLTAGKHRGTRGVVESFDDEFVTLTTDHGPISTKKEYAFVLGGKQ